MTIKNSFEKFGEKFQIKVLYHIITDKSFLLQISEILKPEFFTEDSYKEICKLVLDWNEKYNTLPSFDNIKTIVRTKYEEELEQNYLVDLVEAIRTGVDLLDKDFIVEETVEFCKQQAFRSALIRSVDLLKVEKYDEIYNIIKKALLAGESKDIGHDFLDDVLLRTADKRNPVPTGLGLIDDYIAGGLSAGEVAIIMAGTGVGKSMVLAYIAAHAFSMGKKVVYYSLELSELMVGLRFDSRFTKIPLTNFLMDFEGKHRNVVKEKINLVKEKYKEEIPDLDIKIKYYPTKSASVKTLKNHLITLKNSNFVPDLVIVDYADILDPTTKYNEKRDVLEENIEQLRGLAGELQIPVWTASQTNREGLDTSIVGLKAISEALSKAFVADLIISIGRTPSLVKNDRACFYLPKNRLGKAGHVFTGPFKTDILEIYADKMGEDEEDENPNNTNEKLLTESVRKLLKEKTSSNDNTNNLKNIMKNIEE